MSFGDMQKEQEARGILNCSNCTTLTFIRAERDKLKAENKKLRSALSITLGAYDSNDGWDDEEDEKFIEECRNMIRS